jgi:energy-coupling factor transporter ATP-binding protein EcfA2
MKLQSKVNITDQLKYVAEKFDYSPAETGIRETEISEFTPPDKFKIGLIVGHSGSGKSTLLRQFGEDTNYIWKENEAIISHWEDAKIGSEKLMSVGFSSIPSWVSPYHILSTGEKYRADLAMTLNNDSVIDEFTSVIDRKTAKSISVGVHKYVHKYNLNNIVIASCHYDIIDWLNPDWVYDLSTQSLTVRGCLRRPEICLEIYETKECWDLFRHHHYLDTNINKSSRQYVAFWGDEPVAFTSILAFPSRNADRAWRGHRTVVLPQYQGLGLGKYISTWIANKVVADGGRFFSSTSHPKLGEFRNKSPHWKCSSNNMKARKNRADGISNIEGKKWYVKYDRVVYSHEYICERTIKESKNNWFKPVDLKNKLKWNNIDHSKIPNDKIKKLAEGISSGKLTLERVLVAAEKYKN